MCFNQSVTQLVISFGVKVKLSLTTRPLCAWHLSVRTSVLAEENYLSRFPLRQLSGMLSWTSYIIFGNTKLIRLAFIAILLKFYTVRFRSVLGNGKLKMNKPFKTQSRS